MGAQARPSCPSRGPGHCCPNTPTVAAMTLRTMVSSQPGTLTRAVSQQAHRAGHLPVVLGCPAGALSPEPGPPCPRSSLSPPLWPSTPGRHAWKCPLQVPAPACPAWKRLFLHLLRDQGEPQEASTGGHPQEGVHRRGSTGGVPLSQEGQERLSSPGLGQEQRPGCWSVKESYRSGVTRDSLSLLEMSGGRQTCAIPHLV